ncbi:MAG: VanW family protein [Clostridia bacterium]|nr:VanW family protein [Clostridia bacterium]
MNDVKEKNQTKDNSRDTKKNTKKGLFALVIGLCFVLLFCGVFFVYAASYDGVLPRISVSGVSLSGFSQAEAEAELLRGIAGSDGDRTVVFSCGENHKEMKLSDLDAKIDAASTAKEAFDEGRQKGKFFKAYSFFKALFSGKEIPVLIAVDEAAFEDLIHTLSDEYEIPLTEVSYRAEENALTIVKGHPGKMVDRKKAKELLRDALISPKISEIEFFVEDMEPKPVDIDEFFKKLAEPAQDAKYSFEDGTVKIIPEKPYVKVSKSELEKAFGSKDDEYTVTAEVKLPEKTAKTLEEMLFRDVMGSFSSSFATSTEARAHNVRLTAERVDGYILMPGDVFSYDSTVGKRTAANGYREAGVYIGNKVETGIGGGICQTSSTLYSAALYANLGIVSRTSHSLPVAYVPAGQDATIAEGYIDLKIKNNTEYPVKFEAKTNGRTLVCRVLGVKEEGVEVELYHQRINTFEPETEKTANPEIPEGYKKTIEKGSGGYSVASTRIVRKNGEEIKREKLTNSVYHAANFEIEVNPKDMETDPNSLREYDEEAYKKEQEELKKAENEDETTKSDENGEVPQAGETDNVDSTEINVEEAHSDNMN